MKVKKHMAFMLDFVSDFADGKMSRFDFDLDYSAYVVEHFPEMEKEHPRLARRFADTIDAAVDFAEYRNISDEDFMIMINNALCDFLGISEPDLI
jgi:hypothetical protein